MKSRSLLFRSLVAVSAAFLASSAFAQGFYVTGALGTADQNSSSNTGNFTSAFATGSVTGVTPPLDIPAGAGLSWTTEFDSDLIYSMAFGYDYGRFRVELALNRNENNVNKHFDVTAAGIDLSAIDAGVLIAGNEGDLGIPVSSLVRDGAGEIKTTSVMINGFYDFDLGGDVTPFVGLGIGNASSDISFAPSNTPIVNDDDSGIAWQAIVGADYAVSETISVFGSFRYFSAEDASVNVGLFPATLDVENEVRVFEIGLRYSF
ncbi:MAG: outer membrane beta-barrel protein [Pseudomonadales bacterium]|nr:outer membrane beta-barrel protein [Pseudomonadales bacterium]